MINELLMLDNLIAMNMSKISNDNEYEIVKIMIGEINPNEDKDIKQPTTTKFTHKKTNNSERD